RGVHVAARARRHRAADGRLRPPHPSAGHDRAPRGERALRRGAGGDARSPGGGDVSYRAALIGTGYIGRSLLLARRKAGAITRAVGHDLRLDVAEQARARGIIDQVAASAGEAVEGADLVVIATPVASIAGVVGAIAPRLERGCLVMDVGSTKGPAVA